MEETGTPQCTHMIRGKKRCHRDAGGTEEGRCEVHTEGELKRQRIIRDERRTRLIDAGEAQPRQGVDLSDIEAKIAAVVPLLTPLTSEIFAEAESAGHLEDLYTSNKTTWQQSKRAWHQPQIESLSANTTSMLCALETSDSSRVQILELGAGKGLLAGLLKRKHPQNNVVVLDRREAGMGGVGDEKNGDPIERITADLADCTVEQALREKVGSIVIAKHFCGDATDLAVKNIVQSQGVVRGAVLAPCCHPKTVYENYCGRDFLSENGFGEGDFDALLTLIELGRARSAKAHSTQTSSKSFQKKIRNLSSLSPDALYLLSRTARRIIEEGRIQYLRRHLNANVTLSEYVPVGISPDNLIVKVIRGDVPNQNPVKSVLPFSDRGVVLHLVSAAGSDLPRRIVEYLLQLRGAGCATSTATPLITAVWVADMRYVANGSVTTTPEAASSELVVVHCPNPLEFCRYVASNTLLCRSVDKILPFESVLRGRPAVQEWVAKRLEGNESVARVCAHPRVLERSLVEETEGGALAARFDPKVYDVLLNIVEWRESMSSTETMYLCSAHNATEWDPRQWQSVAAVAPPPRCLSRIMEVAERTSIFAKGKGVVLSVKAEKERSVVEPALQNICGDVCWHEVLLARNGAWEWGDGGVPSFSGVATVVLLLECVKEDTLSALCTLRGVLPAGVAFVCSIKICPPAKRNSPAFVKQAYAQVAATLRPAVANLEILHLVTDKEHERTLLGAIRGEEEEETD